MRVIKHLYLLTCFFPYLRIIPIQTDTQPNALLIGFIYLSIQLLILKKLSFPKPLLLLLALFISSIGLIPISSFPISLNIVILLNYLSILINTLIVYNILQNFRIPHGLFLKYVSIWFIFGFIQKFIFPNFGSFLMSVPRIGIEGGRGVLSLAPEPTLYASMSLLLIIYCLINYQIKESIWSIALLVLQIVFFATSSTIILIITLSFAILYIINLFTFRFKKIMVISFSFIAISAFLFLASSILPESRFTNLIRSAIKAPQELIVKDESIARRFMRAYYPIQSLYDNKLIPQGYGKFDNYIQKVNSPAVIELVLESSNTKEKNRIGGSYSMAFFQLGGIGLLLPIFVLICFLPLLRKKQVYLISFIALNILLLTQIPLMLPTTGLVLGSALSKSNMSKKIT